MHLPFCPYKCHYCDFVAVAAGPRVTDRWLRRYLAALTLERQLRAAEFDGPPETVFYGGGTPTLVPAAELAALHLRLEAPTPHEVTVEANPETVDEAGLRLLRAAGVNRLSLGLQAWQDELLAGLGRHCTHRDFLRAFAAARAAGFDNIAVDLMYGLPAQSLAMWGESLAAVLDLAPEHVSAYSLQIEPGTVFGARAPATPGEDLEARMYEMACERLAAAGYEHYEISNWARSGRQCRHNLLYWRNAAWIGLGIGAASHRPGLRRTNAARLAPYCAELEAGRLPPSQEEACDEPSDTMILGLRLVGEGVARGSFLNRFGVVLDDAYGDAVRQSTAAGLLADDGENLRLTRRGLLLGNRVFARFV